MDWQTWQHMPEHEKAKHRDLSDLNPQLSAFVGARVEVETDYGEKRRFWVGRSTGWKPVYLEILTSRSSGGSACEKHYKSVRLIRRR